MVMPPQLSILVNGKNITYRDQGRGQAFIFLHGLAGNARSWQKQFGEFSHNHRVIAWDAPGYGGSDIVAADAGTYANTLNALFNHLKLNEVFLVGHSMGGIVAGNYVEKFPKRVKALVLSCTFWGGTKPKGEALGSGYQARVDSLGSISAEEYGQQRAAAMLAQDAKQDDLDLAADIASETRADGLAAASRMLQEADTRNSLRSINLPTTVLSAEMDPVIGFQTTTNLTALIPDADHIVIQGSGHAPYLEKPVAYNTALRKAFDIPV